MTSPMPPRRNSIRRTLRLPVSLGRRLPALTADVSRGGFQAELPQVFLPGSKVHGFFLVNDVEVAFRGTVAWAEAGNPQLSVFSRIGVSFDSLPPQLSSLLEKAEKSDRRPKKLKAR
ncbi:MAG: PilZ domain-containing protein [Myxococcaceae bacterium]